MAAVQPQPTGQWRSDGQFYPVSGAAAGSWGAGRDGLGEGWVLRMVGGAGVENDGENRFENDGENKFRTFECNADGFAVVYRVTWHTGVSCWQICGLW